MPEHNTIRILHIMSSFGGGISTFINNLATEIHKFGIVFDVVCLNDVPKSFIASIRETGGDVYRIHNPKTRGWRAFRQSYRRVLELYQYDIIHCHISGYRAMAYKYFANRFSQADFIIHAHHYIDVNSLSVLQRFKHFLNQQINQSLSTKYVGCSRQAIQSLFGYNMSHEEIIVIPNSINPFQFLYEEENWNQLRKQGRLNYNINSETILIGQIGRLAPVKNHRLSLQIAKLAKEKGLDLMFIIAGEGELKNKLEQSIEMNDLEDYVLLVGRVNVQYLFPTLDVIIFPSYNEGLGTIAIEGQAAGIPIVMSETIPPEIELNLNLIRRVKLSSDPSVWLLNLIKATEIKKISSDQRLLALKQHNYTNYQAAKLYATLIAGQTNY